MIYRMVRRGEALCHYCGRLAETVDHKKAKSKGGTYAPENLVPACSPCNQIKGDMDYQEFMRRRNSKAVCLGCNHYERDHKWWQDPPGSCLDDLCRCGRFGYDDSKDRKETV